MLKTLNSSTMIIGTGLMLSPTTTSTNSIDNIDDSNPGEIEYDVKPSRLATAALASTTTTAAPIIQNAEESRIIGTASAIVETTPEADLENYLDQLNDLEFSMMMQENNSASVEQTIEQPKIYTK